MRVKLFTLRYSATLGGFDETPLAEFARDKEVLAFREHMAPATVHTSNAGRALMASMSSCGAMWAR